MDITVLRYDTVGSTNTEAADHARRGADEGLCIIAREQTAGRGRYGRTWVSGKDAGLYMSLVLRPGIEQQRLPLITLLAGVAVHDSLTEFGISPDIKWVNDVLVNGKKICGILADAVETSRGIAVILGIGINLGSGNFPPEVAEIATSVEAETQRSVSPDEMAVAVCGRLRGLYNEFVESADTAFVIDKWRDRSSYFTGKDVRVSIDGTDVTGTTDGLEDNGALRVRTADGSIKIIHAGDVEHIRSLEQLTLN